MTTPKEPPAGALVDYLPLDPKQTWCFRYLERSGKLDDLNIALSGSEPRDPDEIRRGFEYLGLLDESREEPSDYALMACILFWRLPPLKRFIVKDCPNDPQLADLDNMAAIAIGIETRLSACWQTVISETKDKNKTIKEL